MLNRQGVSTRTSVNIKFGNIVKPWNQSVDKLRSKQVAIYKVIVTSALEDLVVFFLLCKVKFLTKDIFSPFSVTSLSLFLCYVSDGVFVQVR